MICRLVLILSSFLFLSFNQGQAAESVTDERLKALVTRMSEPDYRFSQTNLILGQRLWVKANDRIGYFKGPCYRVIFEIEGQQGATHILPSIHTFPFKLLPLGFRQVIRDSNFMVKEAGYSPKEAHIPNFSPADWQDPSSGIMPKICTLNGPVYTDWFNHISPYAQRKLKEIFRVENLGSDPVKIAKAFNRFHPFFFYLGTCIGFSEKEQSMEEFAEEQFGTWLELEPEAYSNLSLQYHMNSILLDQWSQYFPTQDPPKEDYEDDSFVGDEADYLREDMIQRNQYWIDNSLMQAFQPKRLGLLLFGETHADGPHGVMTFLKSEVAESNWVKFKRSPPEIRRWKGIHFLRIEQLEPSKRRWVEIPLERMP
jgi:hypothetical protein